MKNEPNNGMTARNKWVREYKDWKEELEWFFLRVTS